MGEYLIRKATAGDIPFLAEVVIAAEKSNTTKLSFSTFFNLTEEQVRQYIISMFGEETEGCEFSTSSYLVAEWNHAPVAAFGAWIEGFDGNVPSKVLRLNLMSFTFDKESFEYLKTKSHLVNEIVVKREPMTLQLEYLYVDEKHRGKGLSSLLIDKLIENALISYPDLRTVQVGLFANNTNAFNVYKRKGFEIVSSCKSENPEILNYLPHNERIVMEKKLK